MRPVAQCSFPVAKLTATLIASYALHLHAQLPVSPSLVADLEPGPNDSNPHAFQRVGDRALFFATTVALGTELYATDGTPRGTEPLLDLDPGRTTSPPSWNGGLRRDRLVRGDRWREQRHLVHRRDADGNLPSARGHGQARRRFKGVSGAATG
ncbi:MAG: hypothetical protein IPM29_06020 [Planctomycetes bacterium]|nr:hypothetical protein [Planctomycetota bacterium]